MKMIGLSLLLALSILPSLPSIAYSLDTEQKVCELHIEFGDEMIAHRMPCVDGSQFSVEFSGLNISYHIRKNEARLKVSPRNFGFFDGKSERYIYTLPGNEVAVFYDSDDSDFIKNGLNRPAGTIKLSRRDE